MTMLCLHTTHLFARCNLFQCMPDTHSFPSYTNHQFRFDICTIYLRPLQYIFVLRFVLLAACLLSSLSHLDSSLIGTTLIHRFAQGTNSGPALCSQFRYTPDISSCTRTSPLCCPTSNTSCCPLLQDTLLSDQPELVSDIEQTLLRTILVPHLSPRTNCLIALCNLPRYTPDISHYMRTNPLCCRTSNTSYWCSLPNTQLWGRSTWSTLFARVPPDSKQKTRHIRFPPRVDLCTAKKQLLT